MLKPNAKLGEGKILFFNLNTKITGASWNYILLTKLGVLSLGCKFSSTFWWHLFCVWIQPTVIHVSACIPSPLGQKAWGQGLVFHPFLVFSRRSNRRQVLILDGRMNPFIIQDRMVKKENRERDLKCQFLDLPGWRETRASILRRLQVFYFKFVCLFLVTQ